MNFLQDRFHTRRRAIALASTLAIVLTFTGLEAYFALRASPAAAAETPKAPSPVPVSVSEVVSATVAAWDDYSGRLEAVGRVDVRSRVSGAIESVHFREGALVKAGDLLVVIDPAPFSAEVQRTQAGVAAAEARLAHQRTAQLRAQKLWNDHAISQREVDDQEDELREAEAGLQAAQASLTVAKLNLGYTQVRAPISGRVGKIDVTVGNLVAAGPAAPVLTTLVSVDPIYASFDVEEAVVLRALRDVPGSNMDRSRIEQIPVRMGTTASAGPVYLGKLQLIDNQIDARSGTIRVRARFNNADGALIPGEFAALELGQSKATQQLLITDRAIATDQNRKFVLVVGPDNVLQYREVTLGSSIEGLRVIVTGLHPDERIVANGLQRVKPGVLVAPQLVPMTSLASKQS